MEWADVGKKIVSIGAPLLGGVLGGPAGASIGTMLSGALGCDADDPKEVFNKINADPDAALKLMKFQSKHKEKLIELEFQKIQVILADKQNARDREVKLAQAGKEDNTPRNIAYINIIGLFISFVFVSILFTYFSIPEPLKDVVVFMLGIFSANSKDSVAYFLGSSLGSKQKDNFIEKNKN